MESDLQDVQTSVDGKNKITYDPALPPASYVGAVGDTWYRTSGNSMVGFWKWDGAAWVQQELSTTVIPQIDIGAGTFGDLSGARLQAGSVAASTIAVGDFTNLASIDPVRNINVSRPSNWATETVGNYIRTKESSRDVLMFKDRTDTVPLNAGGALRVSFTATADDYVRAQFRIWAYPDAADGGASGQRQVSGSYLEFPAGADRRVETTLDIPTDFGDGVIYKSWIIGLAPHSSSAPMRNLGVRDVSIYRMTGRTLIQDGAITTDKLAVGSITAESGIIESLDLGKATVGELDGARIMGQTIHGEQLSGDAIDGKVITAPTIQSARSGQRWVGDPNGISVINEDNDVRTQLSPDGSTFKGEVEADTLVVNEGAEFKGNNTLAQGAKLTLAAGVTDPTAPPVVQPYWDGIEFDYPVYGGQESTTDVTGLAFDGTNYWTVKKSGNWGDYPNGVFGNAVRINATTGATTGFAVPFTNSNERFGVTCIGSELFWLYRSGYEGRILVTDLNCVKKRETSWNLGYSKTSPLTYKPGIGNDGTNLVIAQCTDAGRLDIHTCNKTTGALISTVYDSADLTRSNITGVYVGNADWGRKLVTVAKSSTSELPSFSTTTGVYDGAATKFSAAFTGSVGVVFHDGKFHTLDPSGVIHEYADSNTGDGSGDWWAAYYWYNWISLLLYNSSRISPPSRFTWPRRAKLKVMGAPLPVGVNRFALSLAKKATAPVRTDFHNVGSALRDGQAVAYLNALSAGWAAGSVPPDGNDFPEAESSVLQSSSGTFQVKGDGSGHWGPLTMGRNGVMSGLIVRGQVAITPDSANTVKQVTVNLPAGRFSKPPIVWAQLNTGVPHFCSLGVYQPSDTNNFDMFLVRTNTTTTDVYWFAMDSE